MLPYTIYIYIWHDIFKFFFHLSPALEKVDLYFFQSILLFIIYYFSKSCKKIESKDFAQTFSKNCKKIESKDFAQTFSKNCKKIESKDFAQLFLKVA